MNFLLVKILIDNDIIDLKTADMILDAIGKLHLIYLDSKKITEIMQTEECKNYNDEIIKNINVETSEYRQGLFSNIFLTKFLIDKK